MAVVRPACYALQSEEIAVPIDPIFLNWHPSGENVAVSESFQLVDIHDGDTPNIRMPIRMLSAKNRWWRGPVAGREESMAVTLLRGHEHATALRAGSL
jgi:hypothetical protein